MITSKISPAPDGTRSFPGIDRSTAYMGLTDSRILAIDMITGKERLVLKPKVNQ